MHILKAKMARIGRIKEFKIVPRIGKLISLELLAKRKKRNKSGGKG